MRVRRWLTMDLVPSRTSLTIGTIRAAVILFNSLYLFGDLLVGYSSLSTTQQLIHLAADQQQHSSSSDHQHHHHSDQKRQDQYREHRYQFYHQFQDGHLDQFVKEHLIDDNEYSDHRRLQHRNLDDMMSSWLASSSNGGSESSPSASRIAGSLAVKEDSSSDASDLSGTMSAASRSLFETCFEQLMIWTLVMVIRDCCHIVVRCFTSLTSSRRRRQERNRRERERRERYASTGSDLSDMEQDTDILMATISSPSSSSLYQNNNSLTSHELSHMNMSSSSQAPTSTASAILHRIVNPSHEHEAKIDNFERVVC